MRELAPRSARSGPPGYGPPPCVRLLVLAAGLAVLGACAPGATIDEPAPDTPVGWRVGSAEHVALWYHGLAQALAPLKNLDTLVVPHFSASYVDDIVAVKQRRGVYPTALDQRAEEFGRIFERDQAYRGLEFLPLYFRSAQALFSGIEFWASVGGDPRRASTVEAARMVAFLTQLFPRAEHRRVIAEWVGVMREEADTFYTAYWQEEEPRLQADIAAVQREWDALAPALDVYLEYLQIPNGEIFLVPALDVEGRIVTSGVAAPRAAIMAPPSGRPDLAALSFVHELLYPLVGEAITEFLAPATIRELGEDRLSTQAAVRGGAMLLQEAAPTRVAAYQRLFLEAAGARTTAPGESLDSAFVATFPLPADLERGLAEFVRQALAGI